MEFKEFSKIARLSREAVITEKIDGTNGLIAIEAGVGGLVTVDFEGEPYAVWAGSRSRWVGVGGDNYGFAKWVIDNAGELVKLGVGYHYGEWWGLGIQRGYDQKEKRFSLFNTSRWSDELGERPSCCGVVPVVYTGIFDTAIVRDVIDDLVCYGSKAAPGYMRPEGVVIYHKASGIYFKKTIEGDESPKSLG